MKLKVLSAAIVLCLAAGQAQAYDFISGGVAYNIRSNTTTRKTVAVTFVTTNPDASGYVTTYRGNVVIPAQVTRNFATYNVTEIGDLAMFNNQSLYTLQLPEGIVAIGSQTFSHCYSLTQVNIPSTVNRIGDYAFEYCEDLKTISLPARLATFGDGVFQQCFGLESINVDPECAEFKSIDGVMYGVASGGALTLLAYPGARPEGVYVMPAEVSSVDGYAFSANTKMQSLTLSKGVGDIDMYTFVECAALEEVNVAEGSEHYMSDNGVLLTADARKLIYYPIKRKAEVYEVPEGVEQIAPMAFYRSNNLSTLMLPSTLTSIEELAFYGARSFLRIVCGAAVPPSWSMSDEVSGAGLFDNIVYSQATLYVPDESVDAYRKASGWKNFTNILPLSAAGIDDVTVEESDVPAEYYNLQGQRLSGPTTGLMLIRRGPKTVKQMMR